MITSPLVSIITPNYNCERFISQTIESVLAQTYKNWEMLIVDDCSTDKSYEIACEYAKKDTSKAKTQAEKSCRWECRYPKYPVPGFHR